MKRLVEKRRYARIAAKQRRDRRRRFDRGRAKNGRVHVAGLPLWVFGRYPTIEYEGITVVLTAWTTAVLVHGGKRLRPHILTYAESRSTDYAVTVWDATGLYLRDFDVDIAREARPLGWPTDISDGHRAFMDIGWRK